MTVIIKFNDKTSIFKLVQAINKALGTDGHELWRDRDINYGHIDYENKSDYSYIRVLRCTEVIKSFGRKKIEPETICPVLHLHGDVYEVAHWLSLQLPHLIMLEEPDLQDLTNDNYILKVLKK